MGKLFGTDGIRGLANSYPITCEIAMKTGRAVGKFVREKGFESIVIGKDTRVSGEMLEAALSAGIASMGINVLNAGVIPTPGVAFLANNIESAGAGIVISASHNPYQDNGIKIFKGNGHKLTDEEEQFIEAYILSEQEEVNGEVGRISSIPDATSQYAGFLKDKFDFKNKDSKLKLVIDCSNGAASDIAKMVFSKNWFDARFIFDTPDGCNINDNCGSQYTDTLKDLVKTKNADIGLAFDGDADRLIAVDENGVEITGDALIAICSKFAKTNNKLNPPIVVSTIMSNVGLGNAFNQMGIEHVKSDVGDRRVLEEMVRTGSLIGGEDSGHMIFLSDHTTGDGMLSALHLLEVMDQTGQSLSDLASVMTVYPQVLINVEVDDSRPDYMAVELISNKINQVEKELGDSGRVLIRYSGTQPLLRVMVEGPDEDQTQQLCQEICDTIKKNL